MTILLSDTKRYELEKENCLSVILAANRRGVDIDETNISEALNISVSDATRFITALRNDGLIQ